MPSQKLLFKNLEYAKKQNTIGTKEISLDWKKIYFVGIFEGLPPSPTPHRKV